MNYIMGFLLMSIKDEEMTFRFFCQIMNNSLKEVFDKDFYKLKSYFYKFNKLLEIYLPQLSIHFKVILIKYIDKLILKYRKKKLIRHIIYQLGL